MPAAASGASSARFLKLVRFSPLAFLGGVILNLMPCDFPVLFIKGLSLVEASRHPQSHVRAHGLVYTLGILVSFWAVVALLLGLRAGGQQLGWGFQFQSPGFVAVMALLLFFLGLSLAGMFEIGLTVTSTGSSRPAPWLCRQLFYWRAGHGRGHSLHRSLMERLSVSPGANAAVAFAVFTALALGLAAPYRLSRSIPCGCASCPGPAPGWSAEAGRLCVDLGTVIWLVWPSA